MDPQQRIFMEIAWESLEDAGYYPEAFDGLIGIYAGMNNNTYYLSNVLQRPDAISRVGEFQTMLANEKDFLTTRISYKLNLTGPSVNIFTACSTSLVAVCLAADSLLSFQCDMALAGGISIIIPQNSGYLYQEGNMLYFAETQLEVAQACSGIRSIITLFMLSIIFVYLLEKSFWAKVILIVSSIPVALLVNIVRVTGVGVLAHFYGPKVAQGFLHDFSGFLVFFFGLMVLYGEYCLLKCFYTETTKL